MNQKLIKMTKILPNGYKKEAKMEKKIKTEGHKPLEDGENSSCKPTQEEKEAFWEDK